MGSGLRNAKRVSLTTGGLVPPAGIEPAAHGLGMRKDGKNGKNSDKKGRKNYGLTH
jgi:hypothetical protein